MRIVPFKPEHLEVLALQQEQEYMRPYLGIIGYGKWLAVEGKSFTGMDGERVLFCAGVLPMWEGRGEAWALFSSDLQRHFLKIHNAVRRFFAICDVRRIEANVQADSECARRWMRMLGFEPEGNMPGYWPDGRDAVRYARVR